METKGYSFKLSGQDVSEFRCNICKLLLREATELPCTHMFCQACLWEWHMDPKSKAGESLDEQTDFYECPDCHQSYSIEQIRRSAVTDKVITTSLMVKCHFSKYGCSWTGHIVQFQEHKLKCDFTPASCPFQGCYKVLNRGQLKKHKKNCQHRFATCTECGKKYETKDGHSCKIECPNDGCYVQVPEDEMGAHRDRCPKELVKCGYVMHKYYSSAPKFRREDLLSHCKECKEGKMVELLKGNECRKMKSRIWELERKIAQLPTTIKDYDDDIENFEKEIEDLPPKLKQIQTLQEAKEMDGQPTSLPVENFHSDLATQEKLTENLVRFIKSDNILELVTTINQHPEIKPNVSDLINNSIWSKSNKCLVFVLTRYSNELTENEMKEHWTKAITSNREGIHPSIPILLKFYPNLLNIRIVTNDQSGSAINISFFAKQPELFEYLINQPGIDFDFAEYKTLQEMVKLIPELHNCKHLIKRKKKIFKEGGFFSFF